VIALMQGGGMKRLMMVKKRIKGQESQAADMFPIQQTIQDRRADNKKAFRSGSQPEFTP